MNVGAFIKGIIAKIEDDTGLVHAVEVAAPPSTVDQLVAYKPQSQQDALDHLGKLQDALSQTTDTQEIGKILVAIGGILDGFFPEYAQEAQFLLAIGTALETGQASGSVGPIRIGNTGFTVSYAPWGSGQQTVGVT